MPGVLADCGVEHVVSCRFTMKNEAGKQEDRSKIEMVRGCPERHMASMSCEISMELWGE